MQEEKNRIERVLGAISAPDLIQKVLTFALSVCTNAFIDAPLTKSIHSPLCLGFLIINFPPEHEMLRKTLKALVLHNRMRFAPRTQCRSLEELLEAVNKAEKLLGSL